MIFKKLIVLSLVLAVLTMQFIGCNNAKIDEEQDGDSAAVSETPLPSAEAEQNETITEFEETNTEEGRTENAITPTNVMESNTGKDIRTDYMYDGEVGEVFEEHRFSDVTEEAVVEFCEKNKTDKDISQQTYVYDTEFLYLCFIPNGDKGIMCYNYNNFYYLQDCLATVPTEAIRETKDGYYLVYDTDDGMRVFIWTKCVVGKGHVKDNWYHLVGVPMYMSETLSYEDFDHLSIGDDALEVEAVDPKIVEISLKFHREEEEVQHTQTAIKNGFPPRTYHLLTDGVLVFTYDRTEEGFFISSIDFYEDFTMKTAIGKVCYRINPLDYVTQG